MKRLLLPFLSIVLALSLSLPMSAPAFAAPPLAVDDAYSTDEDSTLTVAAPGVLDNDSDIDGNQIYVDSYTQPTNGSVSANATGAFRYTPDPDFNGDDVFTYTVADGTGLSDNATVTVTVNPVNDPPVANDDSATTDEDTAVTVDAAANDTDVDGNLDPTTAAVVSGASDGSVTNNGDGTFTYTPDLDFNGTDSFMYEISDTDSLSDNATVTVTVNSVNDPPVADANGPYTVDEGTELTLDASGSYDVDGDDLQFQWDFENDGTWDTSWSDNSSANYTWYDNQSVTVKVQITDGELSDNATASVTVLNVPPTVEAGPDQMVYSGENVTVAASFADPGTLDTHTATIDWGDGNTGPGTVTESGGSGNVTGSHTYYVPGIYTVTVTVEDDDGDSDSDSFDVEVKNITVDIDIKPGGDPNSINLGSNGRIPVAILTTEDFDATGVDADTVRFGPAEAEPVHYAIEDVDDDGDDDMILHFNTQDIGLIEEDVEATLTGQTTDGRYFTGDDSVRIVPPQGKPLPNGKAVGKENAPGQNKTEGSNSGNGKALGKDDAPGQNKTEGSGNGANGKATGKDNAPGQNKTNESGSNSSPDSNGEAVGKDEAPGQNNGNNSPGVEGKGKDK